MSESMRFAVAVHVLTVLAYVSRQDQDRLSSTRIAKSVGTSPVVIRQLLRDLKKAGLVLSKEGKGGGVRLARAPSRISLGEVFAAVERGRILAPNDKKAFKACPVSCGMREVFGWISSEVDSAVARALEGKTLGDLLGRIDGAG